MWLDAQRAWCIAAARVTQEPLDQQLRDAEAQARDRAESILIDLMMEDNAESAARKYSSVTDQSDPSGS